MVFLSDMHREIDGAHDAVADFFLDDLLQRHAVDLHDLIKSVDERIGRHYVAQALDQGLHPLLANRRIHPKRRAEFGGFPFRSRRLPVEYSGDADLVEFHSSAELAKADPEIFLAASSCSIILANSI